MLSMTDLCTMNGVLSTKRHSLPVGPVVKGYMMTKGKN